MGNPRVKNEIRRKQQRSVDTKLAILQAALGEFASLGFDGATARGIANKAGLNHTLITHHFGNKSDLWKATAEYMFGIFNDRIEARRSSLKGIDDATLVRLLLREFILFSASLPEFQRFMAQANHGSPDRMEWLVNTFLEAGSIYELDIITLAQKVGVFVQGDTVHLRYLFIGAATSIFSLSAEFNQLTGKQAYSEEVVDKHINLVLELFRIETSTEKGTIK